MKVKKQSTKSKTPRLARTIKVKRKSGDSNEESTVGKALESAKKFHEKKKLSEAKKSIKSLPTSLRPQRKTGKVVKRLRTRFPRVKTERGLVYIGHIPHGFYEKQMEEYFKQFGKVTRVRVSRSRNTGKSRGYGYVEFEVPEVAKIAAETMNNYLMCGRLLKASYIPPEEQHIGFFFGNPWSKQVYPKLTTRERTVKLKNSLGTEKVHEKFVTKTKSKLSSLEKKLKDKGIDINLQDLVVEKS